jgi:hypothetical protein
VYVFACRLLELIVLLGCRDRSKELEILVLRHELAILRRQVARLWTFVTESCSVRLHELRGAAGATGPRQTASEQEAVARRLGRAHESVKRLLVSARSHSRARSWRRRRRTKAPPRDRRPRWCSARASGAGRSRRSPTNQSSHTRPPPSMSPISGDAPPARR